MYDRVDNSLDFCAREQKVIDFWNQNNIFQKTLQKTQGKPEFTFYDGPPTANGKPHIGHILTRVMKDIIPRYKTMKGYHVDRIAGWDTHGLPVELEVEKLLGIDGKQDIEKYGIEPFIKKCKESVWKYKTEWEKMSERVGYWVDMENPYITYDDKYIESVWWSLKQIFDRGLIYKGHKIVPYCPRCGTALSSHEVAQGYKDITEKSIVVGFELVDRPGVYFLAWTTTPWTLPSNVALCMHAKEDYAEIEADGARYILAKELIDKHFEQYNIIEVKKGKDYEGIRYKPLFDFAGEQNAWYITNDDYVTLTEGTGIVHIAPAFGEDDALVGKKYNLPFVQMVDERGLFVEEAGFLQGKFVKDADKDIVKDLKSRGLLFSEIDYEHSYPFCWRCNTPLLYYARSAWFIEMTKLKDQLLKNNAMINWLPESIGKGRFGNFLENVVDWGLSRERYWGTPFPIWVCGDCEHKRAVGSKQELKDLGGLTEDIELHKPYIDNVTFKCDKCGGVMRRTPEVIDCWYDSGAMPFAQYHYPFENQEKFKAHFPADFISEAVDQTRGWFYTLLAISTLLFDQPAYKNCLVLGHVCDEKGEKMSKHKGNVIDPWDVLDNQGADAVRWYFCTASAPWLPSRFYHKAVSESQRKFLGTLWNTYSFFVLYAEIDQYDPTKYNLKDCKLSLMDRWILSELNSLIDFVDKSLEEYNIIDSARQIQKFTDDLSNWYIRRSRERFWGSGMGEDKIAAYTTLYHVLTQLIKLCAPFVPFVTETIYQNIVRNVDKNAPESTHLCDYPVADYSLIDKKLDEGMQTIIDCAVLGRALRNAVNIKNRQPLKKMYIALANRPKPDQELLDVLADELNVKEIEVVESAAEFIQYSLKPQLKTLGPKYGKNLAVVREVLDTRAQDIIKAVKDGGVYKTEHKGVEIELVENDLLISVQSKEGFDSQSDDNITVIMDTKLTPELILEGYERELISKIQTMRKEAGFEVTDYINIGYQTYSQDLKKVLDQNFESIKKDVLASGLFDNTIDGYTKDWDINGQKIKLSVQKI
jgi:isoleucyl-tRNA synthetase